MFKKSLWIFCTVLLCCAVARAASITISGIEIIVPGPQGINGAGVPAGGTPGQFLAKKGYGNYSGQWVNPPAGTGDMTAAMYDPTGKHADAFDYNNLDNKPTIPAPLANAATLGKITESGGQPLWNGGTWPGGSGGGAVSSVNGQTGVVTVATAAQGAKADTAVQPPSVSSTLMGWASGAWTGIRAALDTVYHGMTVTWGEITGKPTFAAVATSGSYADLSSKPALPQAATCTGTDKISAYNATTGAYTCTADQTGTVGSGITSLNGATVSSQTFANGSNVTVSTNTGTGVHTIGITGTIADSNIASAATWNAKPSLTSTAPNMDGAASAGSGSTAARVDHVHPTDTTRLPVDNPTATGTVTAPFFASNATDGHHDIFCANSGDMDTTRDSVALPLPNSTAWGTADAGRYCFNSTTGKYRTWLCPSGVCALADWQGGGGGSFATLTGSPSDNTALNTALNGKQASLGFTPLNPTSNLAELSNKASAIANLGAAAAVGNQDIEITDATKGLLLRSTGGNRYRLLVADNGTLSTSLVNATVFAPNAPSGLSASGGDLQTTINWSSSVVDASHSAATSYDVLWGTTSGGESNTLAGVTSPYTHTGLTAATTYFYKVRANNTVGSATSATETSATTNSTTYAPNAPIGVTATAGDSLNTIAWTAGTVDGTHSAATSYNLLWGTSAGNEPNTIAGVSSGYVHTGLTNGAPYYYKVQALNSAGNSTSVSEATATPNVAPWYQQGGVSSANVVAVYQPKGAASQSASYTNIANPGTYTAGLGVAPTWSAGTGWTFNGTSQYLTTGLTPTDNYTVIVRYTGATFNANPSASIGFAEGSAHFAMMFDASTHYLRYMYGNQDITTTTVAATSGVMAMTSNALYYNGSSLQSLTETWTALSKPILIGTTANTANFNAWWFNGSIAAVAVYNTALTPTQITAITSAMNAL